MSKPKPPNSLSVAGKALWRDVVGKYELRTDELRVLSSACVAADMEAELFEAWDGLGRPYMSKGSMGQEVEHPLIGSIDKQAKTKAKFLAQLKLPDEGGETSDRNQQRDAANTRWAQAHGASA